MAQVQGVAGDASANGTQVLTLPSAGTVGNAMIVIVGIRATFSGVTDNASTPNTYTQEANITDGGGNRLYVYRCKNMAFSPSTVSIQSTLNPCCFMAFEESGLDTSAVADFTATGQNQVGVTSWTTGNPATTSHAKVCLYSAAFNVASSNRSFTPGSGWSVTTGTNITSGHHGNATDGDDLFAQRQEVSVTGVYPGTGGCSTSTVISAVVAFVQNSATDTGITPSVGTISVNGVTPAVTPAQNTLIKPFVAWKQNGKILVPDRRIFLPTRLKRAA